MTRMMDGFLVTIMIAATALAAGAADTVSSECPVQSDGVFVVSPLIGWNRNELKIPAQGPMRPATTLTDTETELGLYVMYASPRVVVNNMVFYTEPNDAEVSGDMTFVNVYGSPDARVRWNAGAGYLWHEIDTAGPTIEVSAPMAKAGVVFRIPALRISLNPYLGYLWESVDTGGTNEDTESVLYGLTAKWQWRMLHTTFKYYLQDDLDRDEQFSVFRARVSAFMNTHFGFMARFEYMEHSTSDDTSVLLGPVVAF